MGKIVPLDGLMEEEHAKLVCYPRYSSEEFDRRLKEMRSLRIRSIEFAGKSEIFGLPVQGKGCVSVVVQAYRNQDKVALKIRRTDADRPRMMHEAQMLRLANSMNVAPRLIDFTENFLVMEFVDGVLLREWIKEINQTGAAADRVRTVLRDVMDQCWRLDELGLDHGELSRASKHIMIGGHDKAYILDFESASVKRRVSNVTSICQYLFLRSEIAETVKNNLKQIEEEDLLDSLRAFKRCRSRIAFDETLKAVRL